MPETRSQRQRLLEAVARRFEVQEILRFDDESHLSVFTMSAGANPDVGPAVEHLTIELRSAYSTQLLHAALQLTPNLTDLILMLPTTFPLHLLDGLVFNRLKLLKTNLPHNRLVAFLSVNPSIGFLDLGPCGSRSRECPLANVNLSRIHDIRCPVECSTRIVHLGSVRVRADLTRPRTVVSVILCSFPIPFFAVYTLSLQFNPMDDDILSSVARFVPMVRVLRLWERADYARLSPQTPRPWQSATRLRDNLLQMRFLDHFIVRTTASFVRVPGLTQERTVIYRWTGENTMTRKHPRLNAARSDSLPPSSPSLPAHPASPPPFSTPSSPLHSVSPPTLLRLDNNALNSTLHGAIPVTKHPSSDPVSPLTPASPAGSQSTQTASSRPDHKPPQTADKPVEDLVAPLLQSFASLHVDGVSTPKAQPASPPLCSSPERATLLTKNGSNPYFVATVARVTESQQDFSNKISQVDHDIVEVRVQASKHLTNAMQVLVRARDRISQQQSIIEVGCNGAKESVEDLEAKLHKTRRDITTLRAEHIATTGLLDQMTSDVASLGRQDEDIRTRLRRTNDSLAAMYTTTEAITSLVEELRAQNSAARQYTYAPRPSFASDTSIEEPSAHDSASSSRSQSFAEAPLESSHAKIYKLADRNASPDGHTTIAPAGGQNSDTPVISCQTDGAGSSDTSPEGQGGIAPAGGQNGDTPVKRVGGGSVGGSDSITPVGERGGRSDPTELPRQNGASAERGTVAGTFSRDQLFTITTACQEVVESTLVQLRARLSAARSAACSREWLVAVQYFTPPWSADVSMKLRLVIFEVRRWAYLFIALALVFVSFAIYLRSSRLEPPGTKIDSPIWESLAPEV
ncbi:hypothetical protein LXA43DRAFT_1095284 [Ganoderma leucocontextum]|nr:hypothetical protein LXA43DRAFT_1095284 [Ganoderma leucocontextum]